MKVYWVGNLNIDLLQLNNKQVYSEFFYILTSKSFYPNIALQTRLSNNNVLLIDNILCTLTESTIDKTICIPMKLYCDHEPYFIILKYI